MTTTLEFEFPIAFQATPTKHRTPKMVCGRFLETFDVPEVDAEGVHALIDIRIGDELRSYAEIEGLFFRRIGSMDSETVRSKFRAANSSIPSVAQEYSDMRSHARKSAKAQGLQLYPKLSPEDDIVHAVLKREWFSEGDLNWLDRRREKAFEELSILRCSEGVLFEPLAEPAFVVSMRTDGVNAATLSVQFKANDDHHFYWGHPVAYFRADEQDEALYYAHALAEKHSIVLDPFEKREICIHDAGRLTFNPFPAHVLQAATLLQKLIAHYPPLGRQARKIVKELTSHLGSDLDGWRAIAPDTITEDVLMEVDHLVRQSVDHLQGRARTQIVVIETLLERWDERPISFHRGFDAPAHKR
jgi:hypothetical protein